MKTSYKPQLITVLTALLVPVSVSADQASDIVKAGACKAATDPKACAAGTGGSLGGIFTTVADTLVYLVGAISVIMIIIAGLRYVLSSGDPQATKGAKDTLLYAIIGIVVAVLAYAAVHFVIARFK